MAKGAEPSEAPGTTLNAASPVLAGGSGPVCSPVVDDAAPVMNRLHAKEAPGAA